MDMADYQDSGMSTVSSAEFQRNLGLYQDKALSEPVTITKNGRERLVLLSVDEYQRLRSRAEQDPTSLSSMQSGALDALSVTKALKDALKGHADNVNAAFVFGSFAMGTATPQSDIDVMVIGNDLNYSDLYTASQHVELKLGRKVNSTFMRPEDWQRKASQKGSFVQKLKDRPKIFIVGSKKDLESWPSKNSTIS
jgi:prevent-host-death family protein